MQTQHLSQTSPLQGVAVQDSADDTHVLLSALADGELSELEFEQLMQRWDAHEAHNGQVTGLVQVWEQYQVVGQCLRAPDQHHAAGDSMAFLHSFRERLAVEQMHSQPQSSVNDFLEPAPALTHVEIAKRSQAANASVFRWKMVAGFASLAAVAAIGWNTVADFSSGSQGQALQLAAIQDEPIALTASARDSAPASATAVMPSPNIVAVANRAAAPTFNRDSQGLSGIVIRDPKLDEILSRQYGNTVAMQPPAPFIRNASANGPAIGH